MKPIKVEVAFETTWFQVVAKTLREEEGPWYSLRLTDYITVVAVTPEERVLLVRQYRPAVECFTLELPAGLVDRGEQPAETARRELIEETGYEAGVVEVMGPQYPDTGRLGNRIWCCTARDLRRVPGWTPEPGIEVIEMTPQEVLEATADGRFNHALHTAAVLQAQVLGKWPGNPVIHSRE